MKSNPYAAYKTQEATRSESPTALVAQFFCLAADHVHQAARAIEQDNSDHLLQQTQKAQDILIELAKSLQPQDPEMVLAVEALSNYYRDMVILMMRAMVKRDVQTFEAVEKSLRQMREYWLAAGQRLSQSPNEVTP